MRCSCSECGTYMVQQEKGAESCCICPQCLQTCNNCMGSGIKMQKGGTVPKDILEAYDSDEGAGRE